MHRHRHPYVVLLCMRLCIPNSLQLLGGAIATKSGATKGMYEDWRPVATGLLTRLPLRQGSDWGVESLGDK
jgi:hypothetical protein